MATPAVEFILKARDQATSEIQKVSGSLGGLSKTAGSLFGGVTAVGATVAGLTAVAAGAYAAAKGYADFVETLDRQARSAGTSAANMQALKLSFEEAGLSGDDASKAIGFLNRAIADGNPTLKKLGITTRDAYQAFIQLGPALDGLNDPAMRARYTQDLLGKGMRENSGIIGDLARGAGSAKSALRAMGGEMDELAVQQGLRLDAAMDGLHETFVATSTAIGKHLVPALTDLVDGLTNVLGAAGQVATVLSEINQKAADFNATRIPNDRQRSLGLARGFMLPMQSSHDPRYQEWLKGRGSNKPPAPPDYNQIQRDAQKRIDDLARTRPGLFHPFGPQENSANEKNQQYWEGLAKAMEKAHVGALHLTKGQEMANQALDAGAAASARLKDAAVMSFDQAAWAVVTGARKIDEAFADLMTSIRQQIELEALRVGVGLGLSALGGKSFIGDIGRGIAGIKSASGAGPAAGGGNTFIIQSINTRDALQALVSPSGELRQANDRIRDVGLAGA